MFDAIFTPIKIGKFEVKNRIIFPPISTNFADENGYVTDRMIYHYEKRAMGGAGLIIVENVCFDFPGGRHGAYQPRIDDPKFIRGFKRLADAVHRYGARISAELTHPGAFADLRFNGGLTPMGPSRISLRKDRGFVREMSEEDIIYIVDKISDAALYLKEAGFDSVEVQGAHGLLVNQFLSPLTNHRNDRYGGSIENRTRIAKEIIEAIKRKTGDDFPVTIRLAVHEFKNGGIDLYKEGGEIAKLMEKYGYAMIQADLGLGDKEKRLEPIMYKETWRSYMAEEVKKHVSLPVAAVGMIRNPESAENLIKSGKADMVVLGRTLIADPFWPDKARKGEVKLIRRCIGCNECVKARHDDDIPLRCATNPEVGLLYTESVIEKALNPKKVMIIGGGPAGLEAARILGMRGHKVILYEKEDKIGGALKIAAVPPGKSKIKWLIEYYSEVLKLTPNVEIRLGESANKKIIEQEAPDFVVVATGSVPIFVNTGCKNTFRYTDVLEGKVIFKNENIIVGGGGLVGCETALYLASQGNRVTILEMLPDVAREMETLSRKALLRELKENNVRIYTKRRIKRMGNKKVYVENIETEKEEIFYGKLVVAFGGKPNNSIVSIIEELEIPFEVIGDAKAVRKIADAISEGYRLGKML